MENQKKIEKIALDKIEYTYNRWIHPILTNSVYFVVIFLANHALFWGIEQVHFRWCAGHGIYGFFQSMMTNQSGVCSTLRQISGVASSSASQVLYVIVSLITAKLFSTKNTLHSDKEECKTERELQSTIK